MTLRDWYSLAWKRKADGSSQAQKPCVSTQGYLRVWLDKRDVRAGVEGAPEIGGSFLEKDFEGWADMSFQEVTAVRVARGIAKHHVGMDFSFGRVERDVTEKGEHFNLLAEGDALVIFFIPVEPAQDGIRESADGGE
jgi:hypothetical protein